MNLIDTHLAKRLAERAAAGNLRTLPNTERSGIDFYSNDYLGLAKILLPVGPSEQHGSTGSRLLSGNSKLAEETEQVIAGFHGTEAALLFNSGYDANVGLLSSIADRNTTYIYDELCHASIHDGIRLALCKQKYSYRHNDTEHLNELLQRTNGPAIVVTEAVFSMDGDMARLEEIADLCTQYGAALVVDEAHATGVAGPRGEGLVCSLGLGKQVFARVHTYGKAMGCHGAAVVGSAQLKQYLTNFARSFIYTTAMPPVAIAHIRAAYEYLSSPQYDRTVLDELIAYWGKRTADIDLATTSNPTPIQVLHIPGNERARQMADKLSKAGILAHAILAPTVPAGKERLRICLHSYNTKEEIDKLLHYATNNAATQ